MINKLKSICRKYFPSAVARDSKSVTQAPNPKLSYQPTINNVLEFHQIFRGPVGQKPEVYETPHAHALNTAYGNLMSIRHYLRNYAKEDVWCQRMALDIEETAELCKALAERDVEGALDAVGDKDYINAGTVIALGLHSVFYEACDRIHKSNMSKLSESGEPLFDHTGKIIKGPNYKPVDLTDLIK